MSQARSQARVIALVGIDGAGKSTLLERLGARYPSSGMGFVRKRHRHCVNSVIQAFPRKEDRDYLHGPFAQAIRWAHAFDFLRFYEEEAVPFLGSRSVVVSDRWSLCSIAYARVGPNLGNEIAKVLERVVAPDWVVYLDISPEEALERITKYRRPEPDESLDALRAFRRGYEELFAGYSGKVFRLQGVEQENTIAQLAPLLTGAE